MSSLTSWSYFSIIVPIIFQGHTHYVPRVNSHEYLAEQFETQDSYKQANPKMNLNLTISEQEASFSSTA